MLVPPFSSICTGNLHPHFFSPVSVLDFQTLHSQIRYFKPVA